MRQLTTLLAMHEIFISICKKGIHEKYILQFLPSLKILGGNNGTSNDDVE